MAETKIPVPEGSAVLPDSEMRRNLPTPHDTEAVGQRQESPTPQGGVPIITEHRNGEPTPIEETQVVPIVSDGDIEKIIVIGETRVGQKTPIDTPIVGEFDTEELSIRQQKIAEELKKAKEKNARHTAKTMEVPAIPSSQEE
jgi:hypothetical protein